MYFINNKQPNFIKINNNTIYFIFTLSYPTNNSFDIESKKNPALTIEYLQGLRLLKTKLSCQKRDPRH